MDAVFVQRRIDVATTGPALRMLMALRYIKTSLTTCASCKWMTHGCICGRVIICDIHIINVTCRPLNTANQAYSEYEHSLTFCVGCYVTFCVSRRRRKMYCGHARPCVSLSVCLCVCLSVRGRTPTLLHGPGCNLEAW